MVGSGRRDTLVSLSRMTPGLDPYGEEIETWAALGDEWVRVIWSRGSERREAAMEQGERGVTFQARANARTLGMRVRDRIVWDGDWDIVGIATPIRGEIEFTAVSVAP